MIPSALVYLMCTFTSALCSALLYLKYRRIRNQLLLWSGVCFLCLAINNILLFVDLVIAPDIDLSVIRTLPAVFGFSILLWRLVWDME